MLIDMRDAFFEELVLKAKENPNIVILSADHGAFALEDFAKNNPKQHINIGIAEQNMIGVAAGLAASGKIVFVYGISPFVSLKVLEQLTIDVAVMQLPVNVISVGAGFTYSTDGAIHHGLQDTAAISTIPGMTILNSSDPENTRAFVDLAIKSNKPNYIRIEKEKLPSLKRLDTVSLSLQKGFSVIGKRDSKYVIVSTGLTSQFIAERIESISISLSLEIKLLDVHQIKPIGVELQKELLSATGILVIEESYNSSIAREVKNILVNLEKKAKLVVLDVGECYIFKGNNRQSLNNSIGISEVNILEALLTISKVK